MFDCSRERGHALTFQLGVGQVIKGWDDGVSRLSLGQRVKLLVPWAAGYGEKVRYLYCMHTARARHAHNMHMACTLSRTSTACALPVHCLCTTLCTTRRCAGATA